MSKIILIRHGQASLEKANYDQLSEKGMQQASILGDYFKSKQIIPDQLISGSLQRHRETAGQILSAFNEGLNIEIDPRWNEFDFKCLLKAYLTMYPELQPEQGDTRAFFLLLRKAMLAWSEDKINAEEFHLESWANFASRIRHAITDLTQNSDEENKTTIIVSSGGAISMLLSQILEVSPKILIELNFQIKNTSFSEIISRSGKLSLAAFNQTNHLMDYPEPDLITYV